MVHGVSSLPRETPLLLQRTEPGLLDKGLPVPLGESHMDYKMVRVQVRGIIVG